jgi:hypothetical protein
MKRLFPTAALVLGVALAGSSKASNLESAVTAALGESVAFQSASARLNQDSCPDAIVLVSSNNWCGSGGCTLLIFKGTPGGYSLVSRSTISSPPIRLLPSSHFGWRDLIVYSNGSGNAILRFNGTRYPLNPSLQPAPTRRQLRSAVEVIGQAPNKSFKPNLLRRSA